MRSHKTSSRPIHASGKPDPSGHVDHSGDPGLAQRVGNICAVELQDKEDAVAVGRAICSLHALATQMRAEWLGVGCGVYDGWG
jgi:hypothetical protein